MDSRQSWSVVRLSFAAVPFYVWLIGLAIPVVLIGMAILFGTKSAGSGPSSMLGTNILAILYWRAESGPDSGNLALPREFLWTRAVDRTAVFWGRFVLFLFMLAVVIVPTLLTRLWLAALNAPRAFGSVAFTEAAAALFAILSALVMMWIFIRARKRGNVSFVAFLSLLGWAFAIFLSLIILACRSSTLLELVISWVASVLLAIVYMGSAIGTVWDARRMYLEAD